MKSAAETCKETAQTLRARLSDASTKETLERVGEQATRLYNAGCLTVGDFKRLDVSVMERLAKLA